MAEAFTKAVRLPADNYRCLTTKFKLLNGNYTDQLGVVLAKDDEVCFNYTDLERTILDCVVRPVHVGGPKKVLSLFKKIKGQLDTDRLHMYLKSMGL